MSDEQQRMHCPSCGADWFSAAAEALVASGARCLRCDGELVFGGGGAEGGGGDGEAERYAAGNGRTHPPEG
jgi:hypothetical protein